jgi:hypothetical protein
VAIARPKMAINTIAVMRVMKSSWRL